MRAQPFMQSILWVCTSCGFSLEGGQPHMECPICAAYKDSFIDSPGHIEAQVREAHGEHRNSADARALRLQLLRAGGFTRTYRVKGRYTEVVNRDLASRKLT
jgi:rubredoxin